MDAAQLREIQKPLKAKYADDPASANVPLRAVARLEGEGIVCQVDTWAGTTRAGLHESTGGDGADACSGDMLLEAIAGCAGVTLRSVATAMRVELRTASVEVEGHFDARGTLGLSKQTPVGLTDVTMTFVLDTDADDKTVERLCELAERYCVVAQTLRNPPEVTVGHRRDFRSLGAMARLLIVHHSPTPTVRALTEAVVAGARDDEVEGVEVVVVEALYASADDVLGADGYLLGTPANFGYMSGALKHFFDTIFLEAGGALSDDGSASEGAGAPKPFGLYVHGRYDTEGAIRSVTSIVQALKWKQSAEVLSVLGDIGEAQREAAYELGGTLAALLMG